MKSITFFIGFVSPSLCFYLSFFICWFVFWILLSILSTLFSRESRESSWLSISDWRPRPRLFSLLKPSHISSKWYKKHCHSLKKKNKQKNICMFSLGELKLKQTIIKSCFFFLVYPSFCQGPDEPPWGVCSASIRSASMSCHLLLQFQILEHKRRGNETTFSYWLVLLPSIRVLLPPVSSFLRLGWLAWYLSSCSLLLEMALCNLPETEQ